MQQKVVLESKCFKIEKLNAKAMIEGYSKDGKVIHQAIYLTVKDEIFPKLITLNKHNEESDVSRLGKNLNYENFSIPYKYVAVLDSFYLVKNEKALWEKLCNNGLFDVWEPRAPEDWCNNHKDTTKCKILLFRIYELSEALPEWAVKPMGKYDRWDTLAENLEVTLKLPIISDEEFLRIKNLLLDSIKEFQISSPVTSSKIQHNNSSKSYMDSPTLAERNLENVIAERLDDLEEGLRLIKRQYSIPPAGRIDLLCEDRNHNLVVIELKKGSPTTSIIDQITRYMGWVIKHEAKPGQKVRGIIVVYRKDENLEYAAEAIPNLEVRTFKLTIE